MRSSALESKTKNTHNKLDKRRLRVALKVLDEVKVKFPETIQFIEGCIEQECLKENVPVKEVIFFTILEVKS